MLVLTLVEAMAGRRGVIDARSWPSWISVGPCSMEAAMLARRAVASRVADVERLDYTLMGRRRKG